ncbi:putative protein phosphatase 1 catalitic subunit [Trypanosoma cruzi]|uniref:Serine/threonine-protein phosphatase n=1 Tax=Trypanosoma cruzi TaxID=5693 RepID=A0A2V2UUZ3_TRYCR|nr:putative protein phosphatase 1 catalitic subunit [Trypanosoma cruzi]PBJ68327.1 protein phosphatase 1 catalitic subunit [Trypanosoma cruzi cruzi]PWU87890.1 putative protein phosphatase 1 catalitic subunit [Trypanosoma cruzi]RNF22057.1 putative protein phosphatase 1 catalitic subunit [Trypanosoma cruzi]
MRRSRQKNELDQKTDLTRCSLSTLPTETLSLNEKHDVLYRLLELLPEKYMSTSPHEQRLPEALIVRVLREAYPIIASDPIVVYVESPVCVCGDLHGQYYDLLNIFSRRPPLGGGVLGLSNHALPVQRHKRSRIYSEDSSVSHQDEFKASDAPYDKYLFLGDYVDRGSRSIEVVITLLALKIIEPSKITLLRGNHEDEQIMLLYGFFDECKRRYGVKLFRIFTDLFRVLPVAAVVNGTIFCMHGGLSPELKRVNEVPDMRPCNVPHSGIICDLLWADPEAELSPNVDWAPSTRRISFVFSAKALEKFLKENDLDMVCRAHQVVEEGFQFFPSNTKRHLLTIFSATNYCNEFGNRGGVLCVDKEGVCSLLILEPPNFHQQRMIMMKREALPNNQQNPWDMGG